MLVQFWTYSCINCLRTLPYVTKWHEQYKDKGVVVIGVHTRELAFEERANVETAIKRLGIHYPWRRTISTAPGASVISTGRPRI